MRRSIYITLFLSVLFFASCISEDIPGDKQDNKNIEISLSVSNFTVSATTSRATRATEAGTTKEQQIGNLYVFLFDNSDANPIKYNVTGAAFTGGTYSSVDKKITLDMTQAEAGTRRVYIVANYDSGMETALSNVTNVTGLQAVLHSENNPWSPQIAPPILMSGNKTHNFITNRQLNNVPLTRAIAKLELNITLKPERQSEPVINEGVPGNTTAMYQYKYKFIDFDKNSYVLKPASKTDDLASSAGWVNWDASGVVTAYTTDGSRKVTALTLTTYLNERDNAGTTVELSLPYNSGGPLPPPEFGDEIYKLKLPATIERNHWYKYDIEI